MKGTSSCLGIMEIIHFTLRNKETSLTVPSDSFSLRYKSVNHASSYSFLSDPPHPPSTMDYAESGPYLDHRRRFPADAAHFRPTDFDADDDDENDAAFRRQMTPSFGSAPSLTQQHWLQQQQLMQQQQQHQLMTRKSPSTTHILSTDRDSDFSKR